MSKQSYAVCCYTCEHNGQETCKGCNTTLNAENEPYENWQLREDLCQKDKEIEDLKRTLKAQPKEIVEKIIYHYDLNELRDQFKNGFSGYARCVTIDGLGLINYLEEMLKVYQNQKEKNK